jgi:hypothetical protein
MKRPVARSAYAVVGLLGMLISGCSRIVGVVPVRMENGQRVFFKFVPMPDANLIILTLAPDPCRPPNSSEDYLFQEWSTTVYYAVRGNTLLLRGTEPTKPTQLKWPIAVEYRELVLKESVLFYQSATEQGFKYVSLPEQRYECRW